MQFFCVFGTKNDQFSSMLYIYQINNLIQIHNNVNGQYIHILNELLIVN
jgi:hypothetical protein